MNSELGADLVSPLVLMNLAFNLLPFDEATMDYLTFDLSKRVITQKPGLWYSAVQFTKHHPERAETAGLVGHRVQKQTFCTVFSPAFSYRASLSWCYAQNSNRFHYSSPMITLFANLLISKHATKCLFK